MVINNLGQIITKCELWVKVNSPTILATLGAFGVVGTTITTNVMTKKIEKKRKEIAEKSENGEYESDEEEGRDIIKKVLPLYLPIIGTMTATIACILGSASMNVSRENKLLNALSSMSLLLNTYRNKVKEEIGEEKEEELYRKALEELPRSSEEVIEFYDPLVGYKFYATWCDFITSQYMMNQLYLKTGEMRLSELYMMLPHKIDSIPERAKEYGWAMSDDVYREYWIPFSKRKVLSENSLNGYFIEICWPDYPINLERDNEELA